MEQLANLIGRDNMGNAIVIIILIAIVFIYIFFCEMYLKGKPMKLSFGSVGFCGLLFIILLLLKAGVIETAATGWSWWWITSPLWGPVVLVTFAYFGIPLFLIAMAILTILITSIIWCIPWFVNFIRKKLTCLRR